MEVVTVDKDMAEFMSNRAKQWMYFSDIVMDHTENYTVPQYGDFPHDQLTSFTAADIKAQLTRYVNRIGSNVRGDEEAVRDCLKIAHYASVLYLKLKGEEASCLESFKVEEVEPEQIKQKADAVELIVVQPGPCKG